MLPVVKMEHEFLLRHSDTVEKFRIWTLTLTQVAWEEASRLNHHSFKKEALIFAEDSLGENLASLQAFFHVNF